MRRVLCALLFAIVSTPAISVADEAGILESHQKAVEDGYFLSVFSSNYSIALADQPASMLDDCSLAYHMTSGSLYRTTQDPVAQDMMWRSGVFKNAATIARLSGLDASPVDVTPYRDLVFDRIGEPSQLLAILIPKVEECNVLYSRVQPMVSEEILAATDMKSGED